MTFKKPTSLADVSRAAVRDGDVYARLREFLDVFYTGREGRAASIAAEPAPLPDPVANAYLAAVAEHLAMRHRLRVPGWVHGPARFLRRPHFAGPPGMKAMLLAERHESERLRQIIKELQRHRFGRRAETLPED